MDCPHCVQFTYLNDVECFPAAMFSRSKHDWIGIVLATLSTTLETPDVELNVVIII